MLVDFADTNFVEVSFSGTLWKTVTPHEAPFRWFACVRAHGIATTAKTVCSLSVSNSCSNPALQSVASMNVVASASVFCRS